MPTCSHPQLKSTTSFVVMNLDLKTLANELYSYELYVVARLPERNFWHHLRSCMDFLGLDPDVLMQPTTRKDGSLIYEYVLLYNVTLLGLEINQPLLVGYSTTSKKRHNNCSHQHLCLKEYLQFWDKAFHKHQGGPGP